MGEKGRAKHSDVPRCVAGDKDAPGGDKICFGCMSCMIKSTNIEERIATLT